MDVPLEARIARIEADVPRTRLHYHPARAPNNEVPTLLYLPATTNPVVSVAEVHVVLNWFEELKQLAPAVSGR